MARRAVAVRREEILDAAVIEVERRGFDATRVVDIARALGISPALVFYHFETKERLLAATLDRAVGLDLQRLAQGQEQAVDAVDRVRRIIALYAPEGAAPGWTIWVDAWAASLRDAELRATMTGLDQRWRDALTAAIVDGVAAGDFRCPDPAESAARIGALLDGLAVQVTVHRSMDRAQLQRWVREHAARELGVPAAALAPELSAG